MTMTYGDLSNQIAELVSEVKVKAYAEGFEAGRKFERGDEEAVEIHTPQKLRDAIVERAKADVNSLRGTGTRPELYYVDDEVPSNTPWVCREEFIVNRKKRTVVVLMRGEYTGIVRAKGIAKCAPNDCFNVHIGKAIALRRALGLGVPGDYLNTPQPTEVRVGDVVRGDHWPESVTRTVDEGESNPTGRFIRKSTVEIYREFITIVDDSREEGKRDEE